MAKKEKVTIIHTDDFDEVDEALSQALASLEQANTRVISLLDSEQRGAETADLLPESDDSAMPEVDPAPDAPDDDAK